MTEPTTFPGALHAAYREQWAHYRPQWAIVLRGTGGILGDAVLHVMAAPSVSQNAIWWAEAATPSPESWGNSGYQASDKRMTVERVRAVADAIAANAPSAMPEDMPTPTGIMWTAEDEAHAMSMAEALIAYRLAKLQPWVDHRRPIEAVGSDARRA